QWGDYWAGYRITVSYCATVSCWAKPWRPEACSDTHRHDHITIVVVTPRLGSQLSCTFAVLELEIDLRFICSRQKIQEILKIESNLKVFLGVVDFESFVRLAKIGMAGREFHRAIG